MLLYKIRCFFNHLSLNLIEPSPSAEIAVPGFVCAGSLGAVEQLLQKARRSEGCKQVEFPEIHPLGFGDFWVHRPTLGINFGALFPKLHGLLVPLQDRVGVENPFDVT